MREAPYGFCPICWAPNERTDRSPDGHTYCIKGHEFPKGTEVSLDTLLNEEQRTVAQIERKQDEIRELEKYLKTIREGQ